jgi:hypothetical protein
LLGFETLVPCRDPSLPEDLFTDLNGVRVQPHWHRREAQLGRYRWLPPTKWPDPR